MAAQIVIAKTTSTAVRGAHPNGERAIRLQRRQLGTHIRRAQIARQLDAEQRRAPWRDLRNADAV
jgi:hypothetical protein